MTIDSDGAVTIEEISQYEGEEVTLQGWLYNSRSSGSIAFLLVRDGTGVVQVVAAKDDISEKAWSTAESITQESSLRITGTVSEDPRSPGGCELHLADIEKIHEAEEYPIALKEHGVDFLLDHRHLWLRMPKQVALIRLRDFVMSQLESFLRDEENFVRVDTPILTPNACEGTSTLFETEYFGDPAYLSQSGQLYSEATCAALGKVYCFSPAFRAEKSSTRRHLIEFWMLEPEMAFFKHEDNLDLQQTMIQYVLDKVISEKSDLLQELERDPEMLKFDSPYPRITYDEAVEILEEEGLSMEWGEDFGAPHETAIAEHFDSPVFVERYPAKCKAFYMEPAPERAEVVLANDLLAPEGYGEIIGGSQRIDDYELLLQKIDEFDLPREEFEWYLDLRRFGSVPHSGFGLGIERFVAWIAGLDHLREAIPFPRLLNRLRP